MKIEELFLAEDAMDDFIAKGGRVQQLPYKKPRKADKTDYGSKHIGTLGGKGTKGQVTGKAANTGRVGKPVVSVEDYEDHEISMATSELQSVYINAKKLFDIIKQRSEQEGLDAWQQSKITKAADYLNSVLTAIRGESRR